MDETIYAVKGSDLKNIANAIRNKNGSSNQYEVSEMPEAIENIAGDVVITNIESVTPSSYGMLKCTNFKGNVNGVSNQDIPGSVAVFLPNIDSDFNAANIRAGVNILGIAGTYSAPKPSGRITLTNNGTHNVSDYAEAVVNVPTSAASGSITITENGTHDVSGYADAVVNVPRPSGSVTVTENGTHNVADYAEVVVNVPTNAASGIMTLDSAYYSSSYEFRGWSIGDVCYAGTYLILIPIAFGYTGSTSITVNGTEYAPISVSGGYSWYICPVYGNGTIVNHNTGYTHPGYMTCYAYRIG